jgi:hypothetical protein
MKTLFFITALAGAVYLIMQTAAGKAWLANSEPELNIQQVEQVSTQVAKLVETQMTEFAQHLTQKQQVQINQLEHRIAGLENELVMDRIAQKQPHSSDSKLVLHPLKQPEEHVIAPYTLETVEVSAQKLNTLVSTSDKQLQRNRQARLQDIAQKMEMSSLQALVN